MNQKAIDLAKKLLALAEKGEGGEKKNAEELLQLHLKKNGLTIEQIEGEELITYVVSGIGDAMALTIYRQICSKVIGYGSCKIIKKKAHFRCTYSQYVEVNAMAAFYISNFYSQLRVFIEAFIQKHSLYDENVVDDDIDYDKDIDKIRKILGMAKAMDRADYHKQLKNG